MFKKIKEWTLSFDVLPFAGCIILGGLLSLFLGQDISSYSLTQSLYPPHALLHSRLSIDFLAGGVGTAGQNPLLLLPYYLTFVMLNNHPQLSAFLLGIPYGLLAFFVFKIYKAIRDKKTRPLFYVIMFFIAITGQATLNQVGRGDGFLLLAALNMAAFWLIFYSSFKTSKKYVIGFFLSAFSVGLHISALPFFLALSYLFFSNRAFRRANRSAACVLFAILGFIIGLFPAAWYCWKTTGALEELFTSLWPVGWAFAPSPYSNPLEYPSGITEWLLFPFYRLAFSFEEYLLDIRICSGLVAAFILVGKSFLGNQKEKKDEKRNPFPLLFIITYIGWAIAFRDAASSILLEVMGVFLVGHCLHWLFGEFPAICISAVGLWYVFQPVISDSRQGLENKNFYFSNTPVITDKALVLSAGHLSGLIPFLPQNAKYIGGIWFDEADFDKRNQFFVQKYNALPKGYYSHKFDEKIKKEIEKHEGDIFVLCRKDSIVDNKKSWLRYGVVWTDTLQSCQNFFPNNTSAEPYLLCKARKAASTDK